MSKYIDEIITDIRNTPTSWKPYQDGIKRGEIEITNGVTNTFFLYYLVPTVIVESKGIKLSMSYQDSIKIMKAVRWWFKNAPLEAMI